MIKYADQIAAMQRKALSERVHRKFDAPGSPLGGRFVRAFGFFWIGACLLAALAGLVAGDSF
ncbi:hypothetical protein [Nocardioides marmoraquaticus]